MNKPKQEQRIQHRLLCGRCKFTTKWYSDNDAMNEELFNHLLNDHRISSFTEWAVKFNSPNRFHNFGVAENEAMKYYMSIFHDGTYTRTVYSDGSSTEWEQII